MSHALEETHVTVDGIRHRVWAKGSGAPLGFLPGVGGLPKWTPFLDTLAERRRVIAPSLPGFPGAAGHDRLDTHLDWLLATHDLLQAAGLGGADLIAVSVSGALAADCAALWPTAIKDLVLIAPFGLFDVNEPTVDIWAQRPGHLNGLMTTDKENYKAFVAQPEAEGIDPIEWKVEQMRALEAAARFLFPTGNTGLAQRLHRIRNRTLLLWGDNDRVMPFSYAIRIEQAIGTHCSVEQIPDAAHLADLDAPLRTAAAVLKFLT